MGRTPLLRLAAVILGLACSDQASEGPPEPAAPVPSAPRYVGRDACVPCHPAEVAAFGGSHHDRAMEPATPPTVLGDFADRELVHGPVRSRFHRREGRFFVRTEGPAGELRDFEVAYTFGVAPLQQLLLPLPGGRLQALGLAWDARGAEDGGQRWFPLQDDPAPRPGDPLHWTGRLYNWNDRCAECHSTNLRKGYDPASRSYDTRWSELGVSCEACHGPASRHVEAAQAGRAGEAGSGLEVALGGGGARWVLDPGASIARREPPRTARGELEACGRCHARRASLTEAHEPGRPLEDTHRVALLEDGLYFADGQIQDEVYEYGSFVQSAMERAGVSCADCHEPHSARLRREGNALCGGCHRAEVFDAPAHHFHETGTPGAACVSCHMPERVYMAVDGRRDHSFRVPRPDLSARLGVPEPCTGCHRGRDAAWAAAAIAARGGKRGGTWHFAEALHAGRRWSADAEAQLLRAAREPAVPPIARATAIELLQRFPGPASFEVVQGALADDDPRVRRSAFAWLEAFEPRTRLAFAAAGLRDPIRSVRLEAARVLAAVPAEALGPARSAFDQALGEYEAAQRHQADTPEAQLNLALLELSRGRPERAEMACREALAIDPTFAPASASLADVYRSQGRDEEGERVLREGLSRSPEDAALRHALGLLLVRRGRSAEALAELERGAALAPGEPRFVYVLGVALHDYGRGEEALRILREAARRFPAYRDLEAALRAFESEAR